MSKFILVLFTVFLFAAISCTKQNEINRTQDFNFNWKFSLEKNENAWKADFDDTNWRTLNLPHDWSVEFPFDSINGEGCTAYLPGGIGWYRKHFDAEKDKIVTVLFDGVYNNSEIWINGEKLGFHPYGYSPFHFNLTPYLTKDGKNNVLAVKVDRTRFADSRWYTGSGIYRNVKLITTNKIHIPVWGTFITTPEVSDTEARVVVQTKVKNENGAAAAFKIVTRIINPTGIEVGNIETNLQLENGIEEEFTQEVNVPKPELWDIENPVLYSVISQIVIDGNVVDEYKSSFGIRTIKFDADEGFFLNGKNMKIKGVCLHHDGGLVGAAVPRGVWKRRLQILKDGGCNAIRISHNPASDEFLELCDEMGFLVQDEFFDEWDNPKDKRLNMHEQHDDYITRG
jgi:beta-galactosidase/beta-glucuronidase